MSESSENPFSARTANVLAIEPSGAVRQLLVDILRSKEFKNVQAVANVKEAVHILEVEAVDWLVAPILPDQDPNTMQLVRLITENVQLKDTRLSLIITDDEKTILPLAFENGLMSYFSKPFNKDSITEELESFLKAFEENDWDDRKVAAFYLSKYLEEAEKNDAQITLCKAMLDIFPGHVPYLVSMIRPLFNLGKKDQARATMMQVMVLDGEREGEITALHEELFPGDSMGNKLEDGTTVNTLGLKCVVVVDPDDSLRKAVSDALSSIGVETVQAFESGDSAWEYLDANAEPDLIIHEWRIPKLTGPLLVQRIRHKFPSVAMVVMSSLLVESDYPLVKEMGVANVIPKPFDKAVFLKMIVHTIQQDRQPTDTESLERKIRQALGQRKMDEAGKLREQYQRKVSNPNVKAKIEAEFAYAQQNFELARDLAIKAISAHKDSIMLLNLLGKIFMRLQDFNAALSCFEKAQTMSPMNIQRLCAIAEVNSELGNDEAAKKALDKAKDVDSGASPIAEVHTKIALSEGDVKKANEMMAQLDSLMNIISYSNNKAIAYARGGRIDQGIELYEKTIQSIPDGKKKLIPVVEYNMALAHIRGHQLEEGKKVLMKVVKKGDSKVLKKAKSLMSRVELAIKKGTTFEFASTDSAVKIDGQSGGGGEGSAADGASGAASGAEGGPRKEHEVYLAKVEYGPGDLCCFQVYIHPEHHDPQYTKLMSKAPHFTKRDAIERGESGGAEKNIKAG